MKIGTSLARIIRWGSELSVGGTWGRTQTKHIQSNLHWFWFDGLFASAHDNIYLNYVSLYILVLGATQAQIGLMSSLSNLTAALLLLLGAYIAEKAVNKQKVSLLIGGLIARFFLLLLVFVPFFFKGWNLVWVAIALSVIRDGFANMAYPAWMSVINETVPIEGRGRYFGSRNFIMGIAGMLVTLLVGKLITLFVDQLGYQIAMGFAFVFGISSAFCYAHIRGISTLPSQSTKPAGDSLRKQIVEIKGQPAFVKLLLTTAVWNFAINVSGPFFNVHMLQDLNFNASEIGLLAVVNSLSGLLVMNQIGSLSDRLGAKKLQMISMILIPLLPLGWVISTQVWHIAILNLFNGVFWGAFNLASFNLLLESIPPDKVSSYSAIYQVVVTLSLALGALIGSSLISRWGFAGVLITSAVIRWLATGIFARFVLKADKPTLTIA